MPFTLPLDEPSRRLGYALNSLDRMSEERTSPEWLAGLLDQPTPRVIVFAGDRVVIERAGLPEGTGTVLLAPEVTARLGVTLTPPGTGNGDVVFLGLDGVPPGPHARADIAGRAPWFAALAGLDPDAVAARGFDTIDMRSLVQLAAVPPDEAGAAAQGRALFNWHLAHPFCSRCGQPSRLSQAGYRRDCPSCGGQQFPRTDPVVIMAITSGDRILLGRQARFPPGMYSCLAGFLEPGETIEDAVRRETFEESGIRVGRVGYHSNQPWPFPASLMIGCIGEALTHEIVPDQTELEDCRWFTRDEARAMLDGTHPDGFSSPRPIAIAHHLVRAVIDMG